MARPKKAFVKCVVPECKNPGKLAKCCPNHYAKARRLKIKPAYTKGGEPSYTKEQIAKLAADQRKAGAAKRSKRAAKAAGGSKRAAGARQSAAGGAEPDFDALLSKLDEVMTTFSEGFNRILVTLGGAPLESPTPTPEPTEAERLAAEPTEIPPAPSQMTSNGLTQEQSSALEL